MPRVQGGPEVFYLDGLDYFREERLILLELREILRDVRKILKAEGAPRAKSAKGVLMPATIQVGGLGATFTFTEFSGPAGTGSIVPPLQPIVFASDNTAVATVDASGNVTAVAAGTANISGSDPGNSLSASDVLTVQAAQLVAVSATGVLTANVAPVVAV